MQKFKLPALLIINFLLISKASAQPKVYGYVIDIQKAEPVANATVFVHDKYNIALNPPLKTVTDDNGYYEFTNLDYGTYNLNAFVYYEADGDTFAFVFQPGELTLEKHENSNLLETRGYSFSFAFSEEYFKYKLEYYNDKPRVFKPGGVKDPARAQVLSFLKPRVHTNAAPHFNSRPSSFIEKKTW